MFAKREICVIRFLLGQIIQATFRKWNKSGAAGDPFEVPRLASGRAGARTECGLWLRAILNVAVWFRSTEGNPSFLFWRSDGAERYERRTGCWGGRFSNRRSNAGHFSVKRARKPDDHLGARQVVPKIDKAAPHGCKRQNGSHVYKNSDGGFQTT
jgi:hypothetical protein